MLRGDGALAVVQKDVFHHICDAEGGVATQNYAVAQPSNPKDRAKLMTVVNMLARGEKLPPQYKDHALVGDLIGLRDCHIENDWVLLYEIKDNVLILVGK